MNRRFIMLDIDGCLVDYVNECFVPAANDLLDMDLTPDYNPPTWSFNALVGGREKADAVWRSKQLLCYMQQAKPLENAIARLFPVHEHCVAVTGRGFADDNEARDSIHFVTEVWWQALSDTYDIDIPLHFIPAREKHLFCTEHHLTMAVEDHADTALALAESGIRTYMPVYGHNEHVAHGMISPLEDWNENLRGPNAQRS